MYYTQEFIGYLKASHYSSKTIREYESLFDKLISFLINRKLTDIKNVTLIDITDFFDSINGKQNFNTKYFRIRIGRIIKFFDYLQTSKIIFLSPLYDYTPPKYYTGSHKAISLEDMDVILKQLRTDNPTCIRGKAIIELAYTSALRPREIYNLKISDIDFSRKRLFICQSKNKKDRIVPVGKIALKWTKEYINRIRPLFIRNKSHEYAFLNHQSGKPLDVRGVKQSICKALVQSGLSPIKPYSLRTTAATHMFLGGMSIAYIQKLLGHDDMRTTQIYLKVNLAKLIEKLDVDHPRIKIESLNNNKEEENDF